MKMMAYRFYDLVMLYSKCKGFWGCNYSFWCYYIVLLVRGFRFLCYYLGLFVYFLVLIFIFSFGILYYNLFFKDFVLLGNNRRFMGKLILFRVLCIVFVY